MMKIDESFQIKFLRKNFSEKKSAIEREAF